MGGKRPAHREKPKRTTARSRGQLKHTMTLMADTTIVRNRWTKDLTDSIVFLLVPSLLHKRDGIFIAHLSVAEKSRSPHDATHERRAGRPRAVRRRSQAGRLHPLLSSDV